MEKYYVAVDLGASSGRAIVGWKEDGQIKTDEVYRFQTGVKKSNSHLIWDIDTLFEEIKIGIKKAFDKYHSIQSIGIDTWGCDYVLLKDDKPFYPCYSYRDNRTKSVVEKLHSVIPFNVLYEKTGIQFQEFNTIYQLYDDKLNDRLNIADDFLMLPEYFSYLLTGVKKKEYTNATTTGMVNAISKQFSNQLITLLDYPKKLFTELNQPGTLVGKLKDDIANEVGGNCNVILVASHDTASAVEGIDMEENAPYISSGTWSLLGLKVKDAITNSKSQLANYSNEGGVDYIRYQKNIMGMWLISSLRSELAPNTNIRDIVKGSQQSQFNAIIDVNVPAFLAPKSMREEFDKALKEKGLKVSSKMDYFRCAYMSLARCYKLALDELKENTGANFNKLYIVGGGAKNQFLNQLTANECKLNVVALPIEASALGNLKIQMKKE